MKKLERSLKKSLVFFLILVLFPGVVWSAKKSKKTVKGNVYLITTNYIELAEGDMLKKEMHIANRATYSFEDSKAKILVLKGKEARIYSLESLDGIPADVLEEIEPGKIDIKSFFLKKIKANRIVFPQAEIYSTDYQDNFSVKKLKKDNKIVITEKYYKKRPTYSGSKLIRNITRVWELKFPKGDYKKTAKGKLTITDDYKAIGGFGFAYLTGMKGRIKAYYLGAI